jgi:hypothetical protein
MKGSRGIEMFRSIKESNEKVRKIYIPKRERGIKAGVAWLERMKQSHERRRERGRVCQRESGLSLREEEEEACV